MEIGEVRGKFEGFVGSGGFSREKGRGQLSLKPRVALNFPAKPLDLAAKPPHVPTVAANPGMVLLVHGSNSRSYPGTNFTLKIARQVNTKQTVGNDWSLGTHDCNLVPCFRC